MSDYKCWTCETELLDRENLQAATIDHNIAELDHEANLYDMDTFQGYGYDFSGGTGG